MKLFNITLQEQEVRFRNSMSNLRHRVGGKLEAMGDKLEAVEEKSKDFIHGFVGLFGRDGRIVSFWQKIIINVKFTRTHVSCIENSEYPLYYLLR